MNILLAGTLLAFAVLSEAQNFDKPFLICTMQRKWATKSMVSRIRNRPYSRVNNKREEVFLFLNSL